MTRNIKVAAAQLGPIPKTDSREAVVARMLALMRHAKACDLIVYPELALTTFFPRWYCAERSEEVAAVTSGNVASDDQAPATGLRVAKSRLVMDDVDGSSRL